MQTRVVAVACLILFYNLLRIEAHENPASASETRGDVPVINLFSTSIYFEEQFQDKSKWSRWVRSEAKTSQTQDDIAKYDGEWAFELPELSVYKNDYGLMMKSEVRHYAISALLDKLFDFTVSPLIVQYEVRFQVNQQCGGAYVKLLLDNGPDLNLKQVTDMTPYTIMFGLDKCATKHQYHFIIRYHNPKTGLFTEHKAKEPSESLENYFVDQKTHLCTLVLSSDNDFQMYIDNKLINSGNLLRDLEPAITPPKEILDETRGKPDDWDEREKIIDTTAVKPDDWDENAPKEIVDQSATIPDDWLENEPLFVPDPNAAKPIDWDEDIEGVWQTPTVDNPRCKTVSGCGKWAPPRAPNPAYKGKWSPPMIDNPNYRGSWEPRKIPNPDYYDVKRAYKLTPIVALTLELWSMVDDVVFDNFLITSDRSVAKMYADKLWSPKFDLERDMDDDFTASTTVEELSPTVMKRIAYVTKEKPWLWGICALIGFLPATLLGFYLSLKYKNTELYSTKKNDDAQEFSDAQYDYLSNEDNISSDGSTIRARRGSYKE